MWNAQMWRAEALTLSCVVFCFAPRWGHLEMRTIEPKAYASSPHSDPHSSSCLLLRESRESHHSRIATAWMTGSALLPKLFRRRMHWILCLVPECQSNLAKATVIFFPVQDWDRSSPGIVAPAACSADCLTLSQFYGWECCWEMRQASWLGCGSQ